MPNKKLINVDQVSQMVDSDFVFGVFGGKTQKMAVGDFRTHLNDDDKQILNEIAFSIDINSPGPSDTKVTVGGNLNMRYMLFSQRKSVLMDANGNYCELNPNDSRYTIDGTYILGSNGLLLSPWNKCDMMIIIPEYYGRVATITVGSTQKQLLYLSPMPLPGGFTIPQQVVGMYKSTLVDSAMRSLPGYVSDNSKTINAFWNQAQARSKNHGLANMDFRNWLLWYMMGMYGYRDSQGCKTADGTLVWGIGLDGTENTTGSSSDGFARQQSIKHGACLSLGINDGKSEVTDSAGGTCHSVNVAGFENPWGQRWEMVQGLCSLTGDSAATVYCWRHNWLPTGTPTAASFANVDCVKLERKRSEGNGTLMNIISDKKGQGVYMIPKGQANGVNYSDYYWFNASGQLWIFGGDSYDGSLCGLAVSRSNYAWSNAYADVSARLAYYGDTKKVTPTELRRLVS